METQIDIAYHVNDISESEFGKISGEIREIVRMTAKYQSRIRQ